MSDRVANRLIMAAGILAMVAAIIAVPFYLANDRANSLRTMREDALQTAALAATLVDYFVEEANSIAGGYQTAALLATQPFDEFVEQSAPWLTNALETHHVVDGFSVLDRNGFALASSLPHRVGQHFSFRAYFNVHLSPMHKKKYVAEPIVGSNGGTRLSVVSWPLYDREQHLLGVLVMSLDLDELEALLHRTDDGSHGTVSIVMRSGAFVGSIARDGTQSLALDHREPLISDLAAEVIAQTAPVQTSIGGDLWKEAGDWLLTGQPLAGFPGAVIVTGDSETVLAPWRRRVFLGGAILVFVLVLKLGVIVLLRNLIKTRQHQLTLISKAAATDPLTGLYNRRVFEERATAEWSRSERENTPLALIVLDLDHFKSINDTHGHDGGDTVLVAVAERLRSIGRRGDLVARVGGEEFAILLPSMEEHAIGSFTDRMIAAIESLEIDHHGTHIAVTASAGVCLPDVSRIKLRDAMRLADEALYEAKGQGRNQAVISENGRKPFVKLALSS